MGRRQLLLLVASLVCSCNGFTDCVRKSSFIKLKDSHKCIRGGGCGLLRLKGGGHDGLWSTPRGLQGSSLAGAWTDVKGHYKVFAWGRVQTFDMVLKTFAVRGGSISGSGRDENGAFTVAGTCNDGKICFKKTYPGQYFVTYEGYMDTDASGCYMSGQWITEDSTSGRGCCYCYCGGGGGGTNCCCYYCCCCRRHHHRHHHKPRPPYTA